VVIIAAQMLANMVVHTNAAIQEGYFNGAWQIIGNLLGLIGLIAAIRFEAGLPTVVAAFMLGPLLATVANGVHLFVYRHPWMRPAFSFVSWSLARETASLGVWFLLLQLVVSIVPAVPHLVTSRVLGLPAVAVFSVAWRLASAAVLLQRIVLNPLWPAYAEARTRGDWNWVRRTVQRSVVVSGTTGLAASIALVAGGNWIISVWVGAEVVPPAGVLSGIAMWVLTSSFLGPLAMLLNGMGRIRVQALFGSVFVLFFTVVSLVLARKYGLAGVAWGYGVAYTLPSLLVAGCL